MQIDSNFTFTTWLSKKAYSKKPTGKEYSTMAWDEKQISVLDFAKSISHGHSFTQVYYGNRKLKKNFKFTQTITVDVDDASIPMREFIDSCTVKPTVAYETFSNGKNGVYKYHLIYIFEEELSAGVAPRVYYEICSRINLMDTKDYCGALLNQLMNGTSQQADVFISGNIYSVEEYFCIDSVEVEPVIELDDVVVESLPNITPKQYNSNEPLWKAFQEELKFELEILELSERTAIKGGVDMTEARLSYIEFYRNNCPLIRSSELDYNEDGYCVIPEDHLSLYVRYARSSQGCRVSRFHNGDNRRVRLFIDGCIIRKIRPRITPGEMLFNLMHRVAFYYDNSDNVLTNKLIVRKTFDVMNCDIDAMTFKSLNAGKITTSLAYCQEIGVSRQSYSRTAVKIEHYKEIDDWYDNSVSVNKNHKIAQEQGIDISLSTLKRYCHDRGLSTSPQRVAISSWYNEHLSLGKNLEYAKQNGIKTSKSSLYSYCEKNGIPTTGRVDSAPGVSGEEWSISNVRKLSPLSPKNRDLKVDLLLSFQLQSLMPKPQKCVGQHEMSDQTAFQLFLRPPSTTGLRCES